MFSDSNFLLALLVLVFIGMLCGYSAKVYKNRNYKTWFFLGFFFGLLALIVLLALPKKQLKEALQPVCDKNSLNKALSTREDEKISLNPSSALPMILKTWYYLSSDEKQIGPISFQKLKNALLTDEIHDRSYVWNESLDNWVRLSDLPEYLEILKE